MCVESQMIDPNLLKHTVRTYVAFFAETTAWKKTFFLTHRPTNVILLHFAGFMTNQEKELFQAVPCNEFNTYWIPCTWFIYRLQEASKKGKLINDYALETIMRVLEP